MIDVASIDADAELVADAEHAGAEHRVAPERRVRAAEARALLGLERQPGSDKLVDFHRRVDEPAEKGPQPRGAFHAGGEQTCVFHFDELRQRVDVVERRRSDADHRTEVGAEAVLVGPIVLGYRMRRRPRRDRTGSGSAAETRRRTARTPRRRDETTERPRAWSSAAARPAGRTFPRIALPLAPVCPPRARTAPDWRRGIPNTGAE